MPTVLEIPDSMKTQPWWPEPETEPTAPVGSAAPQPSWWHKAVARMARLVSSPPSYTRQEQPELQAIDRLIRQYPHESISILCG